MIGPGDYFQTQFNYTVGAVRYAALTPSGAGCRLVSLATARFQPWRGLLPGWRVLRRKRHCCGHRDLPWLEAPVCPADHSLERSGCLRALLDPEPAYVCCRRLHRHQLRRRGVRHDVRQHECRWCQYSSRFATTANCGAGSFDWSHYSISSRTQWNITKDFYVGLEGYYSHLNTMSKGALVTYTASAAALSRPVSAR